MGDFRSAFFVVKLIARPGYAPTKVSPKPLTICYCPKGTWKFDFFLKDKSKIQLIYQFTSVYISEESPDKGFLVWITKA